MKLLLAMSRWIVGLLFIFSGLIKANDPLGLSYKMQEFFEAWHISFLNSLSLSSSIAMNILEVVAGVAIIVGWKSKFFSRLLLMLIVFFTFLTSYVLFSGKITACGCFGDCVPLTPIQTFTKDIILLILILFIAIKQDQIKSYFNQKISVYLILSSMIFTSFFQWYSLQHLPILDCLPYKKGNNILQQMQPPPNSISDSIAIFYTYERNGEIIKIDASSFPDDFDSTYIQVGDEERVVLRKGNNTPKVVDFTLCKLGTNENIATQIFSQEKEYVLIFVKKFPNDPTKINSFLKWEIIQELKNKGFKIYIVTSDVSIGRNLILQDIEFLKLDGTVLKTAARGNPTFFLMNGATIKNKLSATDAEDLLK